MPKVPTRGLHEQSKNGIQMHNVENELSGIECRDENKWMSECVCAGLIFNIDIKVKYNISVNILYKHLP